MIRRVVPTALLASASALALAACGSSHPAASPRTAALSYFPSDTPVVATVGTMANGASAVQLKDLERHAQSTRLLQAGAFQLLAKYGIDYNRDVKPLLGNPIALGIGSSQVGAGETTFLAAWQTRSASALHRLIAGQHGLAHAGSSDGATLYRGSSFALAVAGPTVLIGRNTATLDAALARHAAGDGFSAADDAADLRGLPSDAGLTVVGDLATALATPRSAKARMVPWVSALRGYGLTLNGTRSAISLRFRVATDGRSLSAAELPFASGSSSPSVAGALPIDVALRDPAQTWTFVRTTVQATSPRASAQLGRMLRRARTRDRVDANRLLGSLTGTAALTSDGHTTVGRVPIPADEVAAARRVIDGPPMTGHTRTSLGGGLVRDTGPNGTSVIEGVIDGELVAGRGTPAEIRGFATAPASPVPGAHGALAVRIAVGQLLTLEGSANPSPVLPMLARTLGTLTGSAQESTGALTGSATLPVSH